MRRDGETVCRRGPRSVDRPDLIAVRYVTVSVSVMLWLMADVPEPTVPVTVMV